MNRLAISPEKSLECSETFKKQTQRYRGKSKVKKGEGGGGHISVVFIGHEGGGGRISVVYIGHTKSGESIRTVKLYVEDVVILRGRHMAITVSRVYE
ncbi:unnamed protein product [Microthlaspi erraticum]|uniref:Uncharacterized protein n=1 Tax=Microthlaspi erraticum TaxID=1685480 RepID=A0A6D2JXF7_9BRAS|nr:unnamed protein product [Microthlaspi erraticum]